MLCFPMLISSLPGANPRLPEHKIGVFCSGARLSFGSGGFYLVFSRLLFAYPTFMSYFC